MKRKIAAIFAADIAGYSRLVAEDEEETLRRLASYRAVTDDFIAKAGGRIFNTAGDAVLRAIGPVCRKAMRATDLMARYGGEEIALLLPDTSLAQAAPVLDRVRRDIMAMLIPDLGGRWVVTASIGVAQLEAQDPDAAALMARADEALYRAKDGGRNRVEMAAAA